MLEPIEHEFLLRPNAKEGEKVIPLKALLEALDVTMEQLRSGCRQRRISDARALLASLMAQRYHASQACIAALFNTQQNAVSKMQRRHRDLLATDPAYRELWGMLNAEC